MGRKRLSGASRKVRHYTIAPPTGFSGLSKAAAAKSSKDLNNAQQKALEEKSRERMQLMLNALSPEDRQLIAGAETNDFPMEGRLGIEGEEELIPFDPDDNWEDLPLAMEGDEAFVHAIRDVVHVRWKNRRSKPKQLWSQRIQRSHAEWEALLPSLTDAYLQWRTHVGEHPRNVLRPSRPTDQPAPGLSNPISEAAAAPSANDPPPGPVYWLHVELFDISTLETSLTLSRSPDSQSSAIDLMVNGYIARSPVNTKIAVSIGTLELFHRIRLRKASFSVEAFAKVVCDYYQLPYRNHYRAVFADTYEIFLLVLRRVEDRIFEALGWAAKDWRATNACRACCYKLENEPDLRFSRLYAFDGNNSLKRMRLGEGRVAGDTRVLDSDYFLNLDFVNGYANEVRGKKQPLPRPEQDDPDISDDDADDNQSVEGDPTDGLRAGTVPDRSDQIPTLTQPPIASSGTLAQKLLASCVTNWKANSSEEKKKMWAIFDEAGVFVAACRHGMILWIIDMIRSGELAKYPLAIVAKILETMEPRTLGGYDIGCSFESTVKRSSIGGAFDDKQSRICVNAFHGYTHCYPCQLTYHPNVIEGAGLEDFETLERIFSGSNHLASITRHASPFCRRLYIEAYFKQWDEDKHSNLGTFILNNYVQALQILEQDADALRQLMTSQQISEEMMTQWEHEERNFFATLGQGEPYDVRKVVYVELLQELRDLDSKRTQAGIRILTFTPDCPDIMNYRRMAAGTSREEAERRRADEKYDRVLLEVCSLEVALGISRGDRWTPATREYQDTLQYIRERRYRQALDKLQRLVIQRLFELHKLNLAQTGYKLRTHLSKSLQTRCKTIRKAVNKYNTAAATLTPPRPPLDWSQVTHYHFLEEFNLLQDTRNDIREKRWSEPAVREAMKLRRRIARAHEEIERCNVEVRRLHTAIRDEGCLFETTLDRLAGSPLYNPLKEFVTRRSRINRQILRRVHQIYDLPGYTGSKGPGVRVGLGALPVPEEIPSIAPEPSVEAGRDPNGDDVDDDDDDGGDDDDGDDDDGDEVHANIGGLIQFVTQL